MKPQENSQGKNNSTLVFYIFKVLRLIIAKNCVVFNYIIATMLYCCYQWQIFSLNFVNRILAHRIAHKTIQNGNFAQLI